MDIRTAHKENKEELLDRLIRVEEWNITYHEKALEESKIKLDSYRRERNKII